MLIGRRDFRSRCARSCALPRDSCTLLPVALARLPGDRILALGSATRLEPPRLHAVPAHLHVAPPTGVIPARVEKEPATGVRPAGTHPLHRIRQHELRCALGEDPNRELRFFCEFAKEAE